MRSHAAFNLFDVSGDGRVSFAEFQVSLARICAMRVRRTCS